MKCACLLAVLLVFMCSGVLHLFIMFCVLLFCSQSLHGLYCCVLSCCIVFCVFAVAVFVRSNAFFVWAYLPCCARVCDSVFVCFIRLSDCLCFGVMCCCCCCVVCGVVCCCVLLLLCAAWCCSLCNRCTCCVFVNCIADVRVCVLAQV